MWEKKLEKLKQLLKNIKSPLELSIKSAHLDSRRTSTNKTRTLALFFPFNEHKTTRHILHQIFYFIREKKNLLVRSEADMLQWGCVSSHVASVCDVSVTWLAGLKCQCVIFQVSHCLLVPISQWDAAFSLESLSFSSFLVFPHVNMSCTTCHLDEHRTSRHRTFLETASLMQHLAQETVWLSLVFKDDGAKGKSSALNSDNNRRKLFLSQQGNCLQPDREVADED